MTENADDFCKLAGAVDLHPGLIVLPSVSREAAQRLMEQVIAYIQRRGDARPADLLVNAVLTIDSAGSIDLRPLP